MSSKVPISINSYNPDKSFLSGVSCKKSEMDVRSLEEKSFIAAEYNVTNCFKTTQETVQNLIKEYDRSHSMMTSTNKREKIVYFDDES